MKTKHVVMLGALITSASFANGFTSVSQPRSLAMGNTGVAVGDITTAPLYNPALLSSSKVKHKFAMSVPTINVGVVDPDSFIEAIDDFQEANSIDALSDAIDNALLPGSFTEVADHADTLSTELTSISNKQIALNGGVVGSFAVPGMDFGFAMTASVGMKLDGVINYTDSAVLSGLSTDLRNFDNCLQSNIDLLGSCIPTDQNWNYVNPNTGEVMFDTDSDLTSSVDLHGLVLAEIGMSMSTSLDLGSMTLALGVTPKLVHAGVVDYTATVETADIDDFEVDDYVSQTTDFNLDVGALLEINNQWSVGAAVKNVFSREYKAERFGVETGYIAYVDPVARIGVSYQRSWITLAADAEVTKTDVAFGKKQQLVSLGTELNAFNFAQFRFGYQHDLENSDNGLYTAGVGLSPFGLHLDLGASANEEQAALSLQVGMKW